MHRRSRGPGAISASRNCFITTEVSVRIGIGLGTLVLIIILIILLT